MRIAELLKHWEQHASETLTAEQYAVRLPVHDAARLLALAELYPMRTPEQLITELLSAALDELEGALPYVQGERIIAHDEFDDPVFEDAGPTPALQRLARKHARRLADAARGERTAEGD